MSSEHFKYLKELDGFRNEIKENLQDAFILSLAPLNCQAFVQVWNSPDKWDKECVVRIQTNTRINEHKFFIDAVREGKIPLQDLILEGCKELISNVLTETVITEIRKMRIDR